MKRIFAVISFAMSSNVFAAPLAYQCALVERAAGHHGIIASHGEALVRITEEGERNPGVTLEGPHGTKVYIGSYFVRTASQDYLGRVGHRKLHMAISELNEDDYS